MTPSTSAKSYSAAERDYARLELHQNAYAAAIRKLGERPKGKLSEDEIAQIESSLPPVSEAAVDTWLAQYGKPIQSPLNMPPSAYKRRGRSVYSKLGSAAAAVAAVAIITSCNPSAYAHTPVRPQISMQATPDTMKNAAAGLGLGFAGLQFVRASKSLERQAPDRKSFWAAYRS